MAKWHVFHFKRVLIGPLTFRHVEAPGLSHLWSLEEKRFVRVLNEFWSGRLLRFKVGEVDYVHQSW